MPEIEPIPLSPLALAPLVSVLIANYNYAQYLPATLDSLLTQTYANWEAVVLDDGSTDGSADVVRAYAARDSRVRLVEQPNAGQNAAVNACYRELRGDVICLLDSDDVFRPNKLACVLTAFRRQPDCGVVTHYAEVVDGDGKPLGVTLNSRLDHGWLAPTAFGRGGCVYVPTTSCMSFRREVVDLLMPMPAEQQRDADGYLGMAAQFLSPFATIDERLSGYRVHGSNMGGLTEPTPKRLQYELSLILGRTKTLTAFVANHFGEGVSRRLHVEDNPQFLQAALKFAAIGGRDAELEIGDARKLARRHPDAKWRMLWRAILTLPAPVRRRLVPALHRSHKLKSAVRRWFPRPAVVA